MTAIGRPVDAEDRAGVSRQGPSNLTTSVVPDPDRPAHEIALGAVAIEPKACLRGWDLDHARLWEQDLEGADLQGASMREAQVWSAKLRKANLRGANLSGADLDAVDLRGADLRGANLQRAHLNRFLGRSPRLDGADLRGANLMGANLDGVQYDAHTRWPKGFEPQRHGAMRVP